MNTTAKCHCDEIITNIHYEAHDPSSLSGFRGSPSFTAVAFPCGHALAAVPVTWENRLEDISKMTKELNKKLDYLYKEVSGLTSLISSITSSKK